MLLGFKKHNAHATRALAQNEKTPGCANRPNPLNVTYTLQNRRANTTTLTAKTQPAKETVSPYDAHANTKRNVPESNTSLASSTTMAGPLHAKQIGPTPRTKYVCSRSAKTLATTPSNGIRRRNRWNAMTPSSPKTNPTALRASPQAIKRLQIAWRLPAAQTKRDLG